MTEIEQLSINDAKILLLQQGYRFTTSVILPEHLNKRVDSNVIESYIQSGGKVAEAVVLDTETTGVDDNAEIIELSMMRVAYDPTNNEVLGLIDRYDAFNEPQGPITEMITELTGITLEMVKGHRLDATRISQLIEGEDTVLIAQGAKFDRGMMERNLAELVPDLVGKRWACSYEGINWPTGSAKLDYLLFRHGFHYDAHRATEDVNALAALLFEVKPIDDGEPYFARAIRSSYESTVTIYATDTPFETKDILKKHGFYWNDGSNGKPKSWYITCKGNEVDNLIAWLDERIKRYSPVMVTEDGCQRYAVVKRSPTLRPVM